MTAESGERDCRSEGPALELEGSAAEFERKVGGDLRGADIASGDGEEVGGSFVIVNGDSDEHTDGDLDFDVKSDPSRGSGSDDGELKVENGEVDGEKGSLAENGAEVGGEESSRDNGGGDDLNLAEEERSNGVGIEERLGSSSVEIEHGEGEKTADNSDLVSSDGVEGNHEGESSCVLVGEEKEVLADVEQREREPEPPVAESDTSVGLRSEVEAEETGEGLKSVVTESTIKSDSDSVVEEEQEPVLVKVVESEADYPVDMEEEKVVAEADSLVEEEKVVAEADSPLEEEKMVAAVMVITPESETQAEEELQPAAVTTEVDVEDIGEGNQDSTIGVGEAESAGDAESSVEIGRPEQEVHTDVKQTENVAESESSVEEKPNQESEISAEVTEESTESRSEAIEYEIGALVEQGAIAMQSESAVEKELNQESDIQVAVTEGSAEPGSAAGDLDVEKELNQESDVQVSVTEGSAEPGSAAVELEVGKELTLESDIQVAVTEEPAEPESAAVELEVAESPATVSEDMDHTEAAEATETAKVEDLNEPSGLAELNDNQAQAGSAIEVETEPEPKTVLPLVDSTEVEETKQSEDVAGDAGIVPTTPEAALSGDKPSFPGLVNGPRLEPQSEELYPSKDADETKQSEDVSVDVGIVPTTSETALSGDEPSSSGLVNGVHLDPQSEEEPCKDAEETKLLEDVSVDVGIVPTTPETGLSGDEPSSSGLVNGVHLDPQSEELYPCKDAESETKNSLTDNEVDRDTLVDEVKQATETGNESADSRDASIEGDLPTNKDGDEEHNQEHSQGAGILQAPAESSIVRHHKLYMIKVPRFTDDELQKKIQDARSDLDKKTNIREEISRETRRQVEIVKKYSLDHQAELAKERDSRAVLRAKRKELEGAQQLISRINDVNSIAEIDEKIRNIIHKQQHETISLKQEKQYIHDINQLKRLREQLSSKRASQENPDEALSQRDEAEAKLKSLKKEFDSQRASLQLAESNTKSAYNKYMEEVRILEILKEKHRAADGERQAAYHYREKLRKQLAEKAKHYDAYRADQQAATSYIFARDKQGLRSHCSRQVETVLDFWNNNAEFREHYVKHNRYSTVRRLGTLDGRSLGPGEAAPILHSRVAKNSNIITPCPSKGELGEPSATKQVAGSNHVKSDLAECSSSAISNSEVKKENGRVNRLRKVEDEQARKAEELARKAEELTRKEEELRKEKAAREEEMRKEKAAAELKEKLRLEQKAKAREAEERKRRKAEKAQARAENRAKKEAELKETKKAKKEMKKSGAMDTATGETEGSNSLGPDPNTSETSEEPETSLPSSSRKRSVKPAPSVVRQYKKAQPPVVPLPLRNRGKRKTTTWIWALLVVLLVLALFAAGNYISLSASSLQDFGF